jgi:hypothetical protein
MRLYKALLPAAITRLRPALKVLTDELVVAKLLSKRGASGRELLTTLVTRKAG